MYVVGTAGHVDHGKSTLVQALTGINPDRWEEERRREMTIDLGFAWFTLPSGREVSLIDVPGHERFIKNMLAGVGGFDAALLVVAADESVMPQTAEHLAILDLLAVQHGVVVLTKADLVDDDWIDLVRDEVSERLATTALANAPLVAVSSRTEQGLDELRTTLDSVLAATPSRTTSTGTPRLPIDRSFTIGGFGTVVTGTLLDGPLNEGQEVVVLPQGLRGRVRGLQTHKHNTSVAHPGTRVAVNVSGLHHSAISRGDTLTLPGALTPTTLVDVQLRVVAQAPQPIVQNTPLDLFVAAAEVRCRATLLDREALRPGETGWVQLRLEQPIAAVRGERCIVRQPSPSQTIGGGVIIDTHPPRHRRFRPEVVATLETLARGHPDELVLQALGDQPPRTWDDLLHASGLPEAVARAGLQTLLDNGHALALGKDVFVSQAGWQRLVAKLEPPLRAYQRRFPLRRGMPREELRQRLNLAPRALDAVLSETAQRGLTVANDTSVWTPEHTPAPNATQQRELDTLLAAMRRSPYGPPAPDLDAELLAWALDNRLLVRVSPDVVFLPETYDAMLAWVRETIATHGSVTVGQFRDSFGSSRKYALALLEHLDERKITRREGEGRVIY